MALSKERLNELFHVIDFKMIWKDSKGRREKGRHAGWLDEDGYRYIGVDGEVYQEHQLIFFIHHGYIPELIDHIDRNPLNNHIDNLRAANKQINSINRGVQSNNTSGVRGVGWSKACGKWRAYIKVNGENVHLGVFDLFEDAVAFRKEAEQRYF